MLRLFWDYAHNSSIAESEAQDKFFFYHVREAQRHNVRLPVQLDTTCTNTGGAYGVAPMEQLQNSLNEAEPPGPVPEETESRYVAAASPSSAPVLVMEVTRASTRNNQSSISVDSSNVLSG